MLFSIFLSFLQINILYIAFISFTLSTISLFIISKFTKKQKDEILNKLTFGGKFE